MTATVGKLQVGDRATAEGFRVAHIIRDVSGGLAYTLCKEITLWSSLDRSRVAGPETPTCRTCGRRAEAAGWVARHVKGPPDVSPEAQLRRVARHLDHTRVRGADSLSTEPARTVESLHPQGPATGSHGTYDIND